MLILYSAISTSILPHTSDKLIGKKSFKLAASLKPKPAGRWKNGLYGKRRDF
jgi:hypothetical protein